MSNLTGASTRRRLSRFVATALLAVAGLTAGASSAIAGGSGPVPDFDDHPPCVADIIAITCSATGTASGGKIVSWVWEYPGAFSNQAEGKKTTLRFDATGVFDVTLTVTDSQGRTGSVTKPMVVEISG
jgi:PKD repeat protein